ncbi:GH11764 [Drosophila grimshawi]|uniref:GH11764 n=2 Tax=Drosophila grimshawi TaxID=7222 RepID=B4K2J7_DROGR|nr:GH11764 [Drosophila grimshawi]
MGLDLHALQQAATEAREAHCQYCDAASRAAVQSQQCFYIPAQYSMEHKQQQSYQQQQACQQEWQQQQQQPCQQHQPYQKQQPYQQQHQSYQQQQPYQQQQQQQYQQQPPYQQQQLPYQQQQQYQQQATCPSIHCHRPCCRKRYARMHFMMPRCWQGR